ncbi:hypothetical protein J3Q64DRAFT_1738863 [Phycomyces blakesleeanus]|uniref:F-box domain-containing protein n=1 Tax=Phycomyces blakesleeanus TaxID=4837 RepID=A0ABR3AZB8_PHYBL
MLRCDQTRSSDIRINIRISWIYSCSSFFSWPASLGSTLMSASKLPFEILSQVAEYLSFRDWWSCSLVCKAWHEPFNQCVWSIVEINTKSQLEHASFDSLEPQNPYRKNSFFVKNIYIFWGLLLNDDQLNGIQKQFPNVKSLELQVPRYFSYVFNKNLFQYTNWRPWMSVKNLNITVPVHDITYGDMETLHTYFPSLEYLKISATFGNFQLIDPHILQSIQPATSLINVHLEVFDIDIQWLVYFAYKFTHVRTLTWSNHGECKMARVNYFVAKDVIQGLPYIFPRLENLYMLRSEYKNWAYYTLLLVASTSGSSLRCIRDRLRNDSKEDRFRPALGNSQNTLIIPAELGLCSRLAHLCLILPTMWLKLDTVLDHCEMLKILIVHVSKVSLRVQEYECMVGHDLRLIKIAAEEADVKVFRYLSHRCRNLKYVSLFGIKLVNVFGPISQDVIACSWI